MDARIQRLGDLLVAAFEHAAAQRRHDLERFVRTLPEQCRDAATNPFALQRLRLEANYYMERMPLAQRAEVRAALSSIFA